MASEKRPASDEPGSSQMIVKRQNVGSNSKALATTNGSGGSGALIQSVRLILRVGNALFEYWLIW
jgi:Prp8 binding protein